MLHGAASVNLRTPSRADGVQGEAATAPPDFGLSAEWPIQNTGTMKFTKNIGMLLLAVYLIVDGLLGFGLHLGPWIFLLYIVALAAGVFILIGK